MYSYKISSVVELVGSLITTIKDLKKTSSDLSELLVSIRSCVNNVKTYKQSVEDNRAVLASVDEELATFKVCPLCGQERNTHE